MRIRTGKKWFQIRIQVISLKFTTLFNKSKFCLIFFSYFYAKAIQKSGNFYNLAFFNYSDSGFESINVFLQYLVDILALGSLWIQRTRILSTEFENFSSKTIVYLSNFLIYNGFVLVLNLDCI